MPVHSTIDGVRPLPALPWLVAIVCALGAAGCTRNETNAGAPRYGQPSMTDSREGAGMLRLEDPAYVALDLR